MIRYRGPRGQQLARFAALLAFVLIGLLARHSAADPRRYAVYIYQGTEGWAHRFGAIARIAGDGEIPVYATGISGSAPIVNGVQPMRVADELLGHYRFEAGAGRGTWKLAESLFDFAEGEYPKVKEKFKPIVRLEVSRAEALALHGTWEGIARDYYATKTYRFPFHGPAVALANRLMDIGARLLPNMPQRAPLASAPCATTVCWHHGNDLYRAGILPILEARGEEIVAPRPTYLPGGVPNVAFGPTADGKFQARRALPTRAIDTVRLANSLGSGRTPLGRNLSKSPYAALFTLLLRSGH